MTWSTAADIKIRKFNPETASKDKVKRKKALKHEIGKNVSKQYRKILERLSEKELFIDVCFYLQKAKNSGNTRKDLDNLVKILLDALSENMVNGQNKMRGLGFVKDDSEIFKIHCEKKIVNDEKDMGIDLKISYRNAKSEAR
ncbi:MAG: RusA family crossover junction endodeoxyribonuclease [Candidatus Nitrosopumilus sp. bin_6a]